MQMDFWVEQMKLEHRIGQLEPWPGLVRLEQEHTIEQLEQEQERVQERMMEQME